MKLNAVEITSSNFQFTLQFYSILGFKFPELKTNDQHIESIISEGSIKLMIDSKKLINEIIGENPKPGNHSSFAIQYDSTTEIDIIYNNLLQNNFKIIKKPWKAFWKQYYSIIEDPDGYKVDLYSNLE